MTKIWNDVISLQQLGLGLDPQAVVLMFASNDIESKTWVLDKRQGLVVNAAQRSYAASLLTIAAMVSPCTRFME